MSAQNPSGLRIGVNAHSQKRTASTCTHNRRVFSRDWCTRVGKTIFRLRVGIDRNSLADYAADSGVKCNTLKLLGCCMGKH